MRRVAIAVVALLLGMACARVVIVHKLSQALFEDARVPAAFAANPRDGVIAGYFAWTLQDVGQWKIAVPLARRALGGTMLSAPAVGVLALADRARDPAHASRLLAGAAGMGWRDPRLQIALMRDALARHDMAEAAMRLDAAARIQGVDAEIRALLDRMVLAPSSRAAIAGRLALSPDWRIDYVQASDPPLGSLAARGLALQALSRTRAPPKPGERGRLLAIAAGQDPVLAYDLWRSLSRPALSGHVFDPDFADAEDDGGHTPFGWTLTGTAGLSSDVVRDGARTALHVTSDGMTVGPIAEQRVRIPPGRHRMQATARFGGADAATGFRWSILCQGADQPPRPVEPIEGSPLGAGGFLFDIPADGDCPMQILRLSAQQAARPDRIQADFSGVTVR